MIEINLEIAGLPDKGSVYKRSAARGIAFRDGKLLVIHTDKGDYKFPGGGWSLGKVWSRPLGGKCWKKPAMSSLESAAYGVWPMSGAGAGPLIF